MKILKSKMVISIILLSILAILPQVYAKTSIEIKPNASTVYTNKTISEFFDESMAMKNVGEGLEGSKVDVHMAKNAEWAIVSYFSNSAYGTKGAGKNTGISVTIGGKTYKSTNGNITGVMDWGRECTFTAGVVKNYTEIPDTSEVYKNGKSIIENASNGKYVDGFETLTNKEMAINNWYGAIYRIGSSKSYPYSVRLGLFGTFFGEQLNSVADGSADSYITFRPVIFNKI